MQIYTIKVIQKNNIHEKFIFLYGKFIVDLSQIKDIKMEELKIAIENSQDNMQKLQNEVLGFSKYGRYPEEEDFEKMIELLDEWDKTRYKIEVLQQCLNAVSSNAI